MSAVMSAETNSRPAQPKEHHMTDAPGQADRYRKRPVVIEAHQFVEGNAYAIADWINNNGGEAMPNNAGTKLAIATLEGTMHADLYDWVIKGVEGEFYPCKPGIFAATYQAANSAPGQEATAAHDAFWQHLNVRHGHHSAQLREQLDTLHGSLGAWGAAAEAAVDQSDSTALGALAMARESISDLEQLLADMTVKHERDRMVIKSIDDAAFDDGADPFTAGIAKLTARVADLEQQLAAVTAANDRLAAYVSELESHLTGVLGQRDHLEADLEALRVVHENELAAMTAERDALRVNNTRIAQDNIRVADKLKQLREAITALAARWADDAEGHRETARHIDAADDGWTSDVEWNRDRADACDDHADALRKLATS